VPCSNAAKTPNPLKFAGVPQTRQHISGVSTPTHRVHIITCAGGIAVNKFFSPIFDICLSSEDITWRSCAMVPKWRFFASCISSEPRAAHFRPNSQ